MAPPHRVLICSAAADAPYHDALLRHLQPLVDQQVLAVVDHDVDCPAPTLDDFAVVVVLVSPDLVARSCLAQTMLPAVPSETPVVPVILRHCAWEPVVRLSRKAALPRGRQSLEEIGDAEGVWRAVANGIRIACEPPELEVRPARPKVESTATRAAMMAIGLCLALGGPVWLWMTGG
jgi:hypothetical protein